MVDEFRRMDDYDNSNFSIRNFGNEALENGPYNIEKAVAILVSSK